MKENKVLIIGVAFAIIILGGAFAYKKMMTIPTNLVSSQIESNYPKVATIIIGQATSTGDLNIGSVSWSGEILSATDVNVQPKREGTIAGWNVKIGDHVYFGQTIGRLSAPPRTPDVVQAIAARSEDLARARSQAEANNIFTEKKIEQLKQLKNSYSDLKSSYSTSNLVSNTSSLTQTKKNNIQIVLQGSISKIYPTISANGGYPNLVSLVSLKPYVGIIGQTKNTYPEKIHQALKDLANKEIIPEVSGLAYFEVTIKLLSETIPDGDLDATALANLKSIVTTEQQEFVTALKEYKELLVGNDLKIQEIAGKNQDIIGKDQDIDAQILQLEKDLALSKSEVVAKQASYNTVVGGLTGGLEIKAPHSGVVSTISKQVGEFVKPEDTIASVSEENKNEKLIRFRIPSNGHKPTAGDILTVVRPGFLDTKVKIKVIGVGISLDTNGSYMADAQLLESVDWPVHASVRVIPSNTNSTIASIPFTAIFWSDDGITKVWTVTSENTLLAKNVTTGRTFGDLVEITEGLFDGDIVVARQIADMQDGMLVNIGGDTTTVPIEAPKEKKAPTDESKPHSHDE